MPRTLSDDEREKIQDRWKMVSTAETEQRINEIKDLEFEAGEHWDKEVKTARESQKRPCLTIDLISGPIKQVTNEVRSARPGIVVTPVGDGADPAKAQRWQGILRRIENRSNSDYAYSWANQHQVKMGRGYWRILSDYISPEGDEQDLKILWIDNQHTVYLDPTTKEPDRSDAKWAFIVQDLIWSDYKDRFGGSELAMDNGHYMSLGDGPPEWLTKERVRVAEYFYVEENSRTRHTLSDGSHAYEDEMDRGPKKRGVKGPGELLFPEGVKSVRTREMKTRTIKWCLINAFEALEETTIPGSYIPIVEVEGERRNINGVIDRRGMVRMAKDPQRMENFHESSLVETISTGTKSRWLIAEGQTEGHEKMWNTANQANWDALIYKETSIMGTVVPPPIPIDREPPIQAMALAAQRAEMQVRKIMGNVDVMQEEIRQEQSGKAINARKLQQEIQSSDYMDNLGRGIRLTGRILMSMAREVYDTPRVLRITGADDKEMEIVTHKGPDQQAAAQQLQMQTQAKELFDLSVGAYDVSISAGKSYQSQRQEAVDAIGQLVQAAPPLTPIIADIWVENMDFAGAAKMAARLKKVNPHAQDDDNQQPIPPQVQQRLQALDQYAQAAHEQIDELTRMIESKQAELTSKEKIAADDNLTKVQIAQMQLGVQADIAQLQAHIKRLETMIGVVHETRMQEQDHAHEAGIAAMAAAHTQQQLDQQHAQNLEAGEMGHQQGIEASNLDHDRNLEAGEVDHQHAMEQGEQGNKHAIQQIKAKPKPKPGAKK